MLRNAAASTRKAARAGASDTREWSTTGERPSAGSDNPGPRSRAPGGAIRRANGATANPAPTAAAIAATPPLTWQRLAGVAVSRVASRGYIAGKLGANLAAAA